ncbi:hypothetical protein T484DRAFT_1920167 [Baffinella frigidus]|nr:hypothetical protein T484DRAFT_1920167 [Cryptophyta sp. CCMP2293]
MVLCELEASGSFFTTWLSLTLMGLLSQFVFSGGAFYYYYVDPTYEKWVWKSNPEYPKPEKVREEILQMIKGLCSATLCPAFSLYLARHGQSYGYCGLGGFSVGYLALTFLVTWVVSDFYEFFYHHLGHRYAACWENHRHHHVFFNPSPFSVIADEYIDQFARSTPLVVLPLLVPINQDMLFLQYAFFFYGFCVKCWDQLFGTMHPDGVAKSAMCAQQRGERSREVWEKTVVPDYSVLLSPSFWSPANFRELKQAAKSA